MPLAVLAAAVLDAPREAHQGCEEAYEKDIPAY
jgi:hypothetical protein